MSIHTVGGDVPTTDEYDAIEAELEELRERKSEKRERIAELEERREELMEESSELVAEGTASERLEDLREEIRETELEIEQLQSGVDVLDVKISDAEGRLEDAAAVCHRHEAERLLEEEGIPAHEAMLEAKRQLIEAYRRWYGPPGSPGKAARFKKCARRADDQGIQHPHRAVDTVRGEMQTTIDVAERVSGEADRWEHLRQLEEEGEQPAAE